MDSFWYRSCTKQSEGKAFSTGVKDGFLMEENLRKKKGNVRAMRNAAISGKKKKTTERIKRGWEGRII